MKLHDIIKGIGCEIQDVANIEIGNITFDSRAVKENSLFVAQVGVHVDGHKYIDGAIEKGATAIVCEHMPEKRDDKVVYIKVEDSNRALGIMADNFFGHPSSKLKLVEKPPPSHSSTACSA